MKDTPHEQEHSGEKKKKNQGRHVENLTCTHSAAGPHPFPSIQRYEG